MMEGEELPKAIHTYIVQIHTNIVQYLGKTKSRPNSAAKLPSPLMD